MSNNDFLYCIENLDMFLKTDIVEDTQATELYPVGIGLGGVRIHIMHYKNFQKAIGKRDVRKQRVDINNMAIMLTNFNEDYSALEKFEKLSYFNKMVFTQKEYPEFNSAFYLKEYNRYSNVIKNLVVPNIWGIQNPITGRRFIDQFNYATYFNNIKG